MSEFTKRPPSPESGGIHPRDSKKSKANPRESNKDAEPQVKQKKKLPPRSGQAWKSKHPSQARAKAAEKTEQQRTTNRSGSEGEEVGSKGQGDAEQDASVKTIVREGIAASLEGFRAELKGALREDTSTFVESLVEQVKRTIEEATRKNLAGLKQEIVEMVTSAIDRPGWEDEVLK